MSRSATQRTEAPESDPRALLELVYPSLRRLANSRMRHEAPGQTIQATALVHEVYLRLVSSGPHVWDGPGHFYGAAAEAMRRILIERARHKSRRRRGGDWARVKMAAIDREAAFDPARLLVLDTALSQLEAHNPRQASIVKLRFFVGLTADEIATLLNVSTSTVNHEWAFARAWLRQRVSRSTQWRDL